MSSAFTHGVIGDHHTRRGLGDSDVLLDGMVRGAQRLRTK